MAIDGYIKYIYIYKILKNCFRLHRKRRNPGCSLAVEYIYIYIYTNEMEAKQYLQDLKDKSKRI